MPEVRPDRQKRASQPEKGVGKRRRPRVAGHIQTPGSLMEVKSRVIRGALKNAQILRSSTSPKVVETFLKEGAEVAGVKQQLEADSHHTGGLRLLNERFMVIQQAMGVLKSCGIESAAFLRAFVEHMKTTGFVAAALERHQIRGASVAPIATE